MSKAQRDWIKQHNCVICGVVPSDPHHVKSRGAGGKDRDNLVPLCREHHTELHTLGRHTFANRYSVDLPLKAQKFEERWQRHEAGEMDLGF